MIPRYSRPEMAAIWEPQTRYRIWFEIEAHAADAMAELGIIPKEAAKTIWAKGRNATFDVARIDEIERVTRHDVIAFLTHVAEIVGPGNKWVAQAKAQVTADCAIDFYAGPTEIVVVGASGNPAWVAADLIAQAEHDPEARSIFITWKKGFAQRVSKAVDRIAKGRDIVTMSLAAHGAIVIAKGPDEAMALSNRSPATRSPRPT